MLGDHASPGEERVMLKNERPPMPTSLPRALRGGDLCAYLAGRPYSEKAHRTNVFMKESSQ